jgi:trigger factor
MTDEKLATEEAIEMPQNEEEEFLERLKESIKVNLEDIGTLRRKMTITVPADTINSRRSGQFGELKRDSVVPGFRKGHAPMRLIEKRFGSDVNNQLSSQVLSSSYMAAVEKEDLKTIGDPLVWAADSNKTDVAERLVSVQDAFDLIKLPSDGDFTFACEVELRPEFDLPELEGMNLTRPALQVEDEQVDEAIRRMLAMRGQYVPVEGGKIKEDDLIICNFKATVGDRVLEDEDNCQLAARPMRYSGILLDELGKSVTGKKAGDAVEFEATLPDDYPEENLRNEKAKINLTVHEFKRFEAPKLDSEILEALGFESEPDLRDGVRAEMESSLVDKVKQDQRQQVNDQLGDAVKMDLPSDMSERQTERIVARRMLDLARSGMPEAEIEKQADEVRTGAADDAARDLKLFFIFEKIAEEWEIEVTEEEINGQIAMIAARQNRRFDRVRDDLMRNNSLSSLYMHVRDEKIVDRIIETAEITEAKAAPKKKAAAKKKKKTTTKKKKDS